MLPDDAFVKLASMIEIYCPKCLAFTPLVFDEPYQWHGTQAPARNIVCTECLSVLSILRGDGMGTHVLQKIAELAYYALPTDPAFETTSQPSVAKPSRKERRRRLKLVP
jgi:hypothetical protein